MSLPLFPSGFLPVLDFFSWNFRGRFKAILCKMPILMKIFSLEEKLFVINLLEVIPLIRGEINSFGETFF
jgi:hypothetical protein